jgi:hypothetical protein
VTGKNIAYLRPRCRCREPYTSGLVPGGYGLALADGPNVNSGVDDSFALMKMAGHA